MHIIKEKLVYFFLKLILKFEEVLVSAKGYCSKDRLLFRKYDPNKKLTDAVFDISW